MRELLVLLDILSTVNEGFWMYHLTDVLYERRNLENKNKSWVGGFVFFFWLLMKILNQVAGTFPYIVPIMVLCAIFILLFWKCSAINAFAVCGGYLFIYAMFDTIEVTIAGRITGTKWGLDTVVRPEEKVLFLVIEVSVWFILNFLLFKWLERHKERREKYYDIVSVIGLSGAAFFVVIFALNMVTDLIDNCNVGWYFFFTLLVILILWGYFQMKNEQLQSRMYLLDMQNGMLENSYERANSFYIENAKLYHDMNHHLDAIVHLIQTGNSNEASACIESLREPLDASKIPNRTGIDVVDAILCETAQRAQKKGIDVTFKIQACSQEIDVDKKDLCALFANILDNAMESANSEINLSVRQVRGMLFIECKNDYSISPVMENDSFITRKQNSRYHGWGTRIVKQIVEKYDGSIEYDIGDCFRVEIMISI